MDAQHLYRKSAKGGEAINARLHGLVGRARSLLILVDGKRSHAELLALAAGFGDVAQMLGELERDGFIEPVPAAQAPALASAPAPAPTRPPAPAPTPPRASAPAPLASRPAPLDGPMTLPQVRAFTCHRLIQLLGPTADALCLKVDATRTRAEFIIAVQRAYAVVRDVRGAAEAEKFGDAIEAQMPQD